MGNKVFLMGNVGKDAELRHTATGKEVASFTLATTEGYGDKKRTSWHNIVAWGKLAQWAAKIQKGDSVAVEGKLSYRSWEKNGEKRYGTDIVIERFVNGSKSHEASTAEEELFPDESGY